MNSQPAFSSNGRKRTTDLFEFAYDALHELAAAYLSRERPDHTLQPTALVHEAYVKLHANQTPRWNSKTHFQIVAASAMRQILVDHARRRKSHKRGGDWSRLRLSSVGFREDMDLDIESLDEAMKQLAEKDQRKSRVVELRFFGGLTYAEIGAELAISPKTAESDWYFARAWLRRKLCEAE